MNTTTLNPLDLLDSLLSDYLSPKARRALHTALVLVAVVVTIVLAAGGDWKAAVGSLVAAIYAGANRANTPAPVAEEPVIETEDDLHDYEEDGLTYEEAEAAYATDAEVEQGFRVRLSHDSRDRGKPGVFYEDPESGL